MASRFYNVANFSKLCYENTRLKNNLHGWKTFTRLFNVSSVSLYEVQPERLKEIAKSPSGWVPPQTNLPNLPFQVKRSRTNNLPVYIDKKRGGSLVLTVIKNIKGDLYELEKVLQQNLGEDVHFQLNEVTSQLKIKGYHKETVVKILKEMGF